MLCAALLLLAARTFGPQQLPEVQDSDDPLLEASSVVPDLVVRLAYATPQNAAGRVLYPSGMPCLLRRSVAERLALAARTLRAQGFRVIAYDCWRGRDACLSRTIVSGWRSIGSPCAAAAARTSTVPPFTTNINVEPPKSTTVNAATNGLPESEDELAWSQGTMVTMIAMAST